MIGGRWLAQRLDAGHRGNLDHLWLSGYWPKHNVLIQECLYTGPRCNERAGSRREETGDWN